MIIPQNMGVCGVFTLVERPIYEKVPLFFGTFFLGATLLQQFFPLDEGDVLPLE